MSLKEYELSILEHSDPSSKVKLKTHCFITLSSPFKDIFSYSTISQHLDYLISSGVWIARGNGLRLSIQLLNDDFAFEDFDRLALLEGLQNNLSDAKVVIVVLSIRINEN